MTGGGAGLFLPLVYARRNLRAGVRGFYIFLICLALGVGAIAGIQSLSRGMIESLHHDGRYILGGDIALRTLYEPATPEQARFLRDKLGPVTVVIETHSMARRTDGQQTALVELKAVDSLYPLYGKLEVADGKGDPIETPLQDLLRPLSAVNGAVVEKELLSRLGIAVGDQISVGEQKFQVRGVIVREPDRIGNLGFSLAPRVMIGGGAFAGTGLKQLGSQVNYDQKILLPALKTFDDLERAKKKIAAAFPEAKWKSRDFLNAAPRAERMINRLSMFLTLIGLTTLLIGGVGISNAVRGYLDSRLTDIATLKCLGGTATFVFRVYMLQIVMLATFGIVLGLGLGVFASQAAGTLLTAKLSLTDQVAVYPPVLLLAAVFGYLTTFCFSLWPIGRAIRVSPAGLFRDLIAPASEFPPPNVILWTLIGTALLVLLAISTADDQRLAGFFVGGTVFTFAVFYGYSLLVGFLTKRMKFTAVPEIRMAVANLHRPGNISASVILSLGLGLTVLAAVALVQFNFMRLIRDDLAVDAPSFFFLDIEAGQRDDFRKMVVAEPGARNLVMTPSFRGRVVKVNGKSAEEALVDKNESWVINSDRGLTYTAALPPYSRVVAGAWWDKSYSGPPIVSIATNVARAFNIGAGDEITVNVLGMDVAAKVANVREIDWASFTMNFAITFAPGFLEKLPSNYLATVIVAGEHEGEMQTKIANRFRNVTVVRVHEALEAAGTIIRAIAQAVSVSAAVTLAAGTLVLSGGIAAARRRHLYDAIILKVLGATRSQILKTFLLEYAILGIVTVGIAAALGTAAAWGVQKHVMNLEWKFSWLALTGVTALCLGITLVAGFLGTWRVLQQKPAPYLRNQ
ncbi:MAG: FtsX-like permease family protein [Alphaproteobacteria bacterium]|nr:FtsX-like permease family protein [Alphaproteobacteria bacterium]